MNIIYNKYFYGFEKEGKSVYYQEKTVTGLYIPFRYPFKEELLDKTLLLALNTPIHRDGNGINSLKPRDVAKEQAMKEEKEN